MKKYKTLIIGSSFSSIGYAVSKKDTLIVEQTEMLDTLFYLPMRGFSYCAYSAKTDAGAELESIFRERGIISGEGQNVNAFEIGLCHFVKNHSVSIYLKCRVVESKWDNGCYSVTLLHNGGIEIISAEKIIDTRPKEGLERRLAVIFDCPSKDFSQDEIEAAFTNSEVITAFYKNRYVLYAKTSSDDINDSKCEIYKHWKKLNGYRILYIAPTFYYPDAEFPILCDGKFENPIEAFEDGIRLAEEENI